MDDDETGGMDPAFASDELNRFLEQLSPENQSEPDQSTPDDRSALEEDTSDEACRNLESFAVNLTTLQNRPEHIQFEKQNWLELPDAFIKPPKMCSVNQFVHIVHKIGHHYLSSSCELVLFGTGNSMPEHFRWMIYCMEMVIF